MRILYISAFPPNKKTAGQNYSYLLINELSMNHEVSLHYFGYKDHMVATKNLSDVNMYRNSLLHRIRNIFLFPIMFPFFTSRFNFRLLFKMRKIANDYDLIYFDFSQVFIYSLFLSHPNKVFMSHDVIYQMFLRKKYFCSSLINIFVCFTELVLLRSASKLCCFSEKDKAIISQKYNIDAFTVSFYIDPLLMEINLKSLILEDYFVLYGAWSRMENIQGLIWFLRNVYIKIPTQNLIIIGGGITDKDLFKQYPNIQYLGFIENPYLYISKAKAVIAPLFCGAGVKVKVIESLASGTPVIGTDIAFEGVKDFDIDGFSPLLLANSASDFLKHIQECKIELGMKIKIQKYFMENYFNNKFTKIISC